MNRSINGFIVLRKPELNYHTDGKGSYSLFPPPSVSGVHYAGEDRMGWFDLFEDFYRKILPESFLPLVRKISDSFNCEMCYEHLDNFEEAVSVLNYTNKYPHFPLNELIAFRSEVTHIRSFDFTSREIDWIGTDLINHGLGSFLLQGYFTKPEAFISVKDCINANGLLVSDKEAIERYFRVYLEKTEEFDLEPIDGFEESMDSVEIGRVIL